MKELFMVLWLSIVIATIWEAVKKDDTFTIKSNQALNNFHQYREERGLAKGDIIYKDATNTTTRLPIGTKGQVLVSDGTDVKWGDVK